MIRQNYSVKSLSTVFRKSTSLLESRDLPRLYLVSATQFFLALLDLIAVTLIGIVTALAISGIQSKRPSQQVAQIVDFLGLQNLSFQNQVAILGSLAAAIMIAKTLASVFLVRKTLEFLAFKSAQVSSRLFSRILSQPYEFIKDNSSQSILYMVTQGVNSLILGFVGSVVQIVAETSLILVMMIGLFVIEPTVAVGAFMYFALIATIQNRILGQKAVHLGSTGAEATISANRKIAETIGLFREIYVRQAFDLYYDTVANLRNLSASVTARLNFFPYINKYTLEVSLVVGALLLSASQFFLTDAVTAITTLAIFLAAATRVSPAILRLQQSLIGIKSNIGSATPTLELLDALREPTTSEVSETPGRTYAAEILFKDVSFSYKNSSHIAINRASLEILTGELIALIGPSGGGKTTLVDLLLGLLEPQAGEIAIRGLRPNVFIRKFPSCVGYVAQDSTLLDGSIRENLTFGLRKKFSDQELLATLELVALNDFVKKLPKGLDELVGERGTLLSGGQRQRMNLARAVITNPEILILDEATSALDIETENQIINAIDSIRESRTIIVIAHRLSTVLNADKIFFIKEGQILGSGKFDVLRKALPDFDRQAELAGYKSTPD